jgi:hypothetical protein
MERDDDEHGATTEFSKKEMKKEAEDDTTRDDFEHSDRLSILLMEQLEVIELVDESVVSVLQALSHLERRF